MNTQNTLSSERRTSWRQGDDSHLGAFFGKKVPYEYPVGKNYFLAGIRTPEGRVKADNDNHYITRNSCLSFRSTAIQPVLTGVGGKLVPILVDAAIINTRTIFGARHFDVFIRMDV